MTAATLRARVLCVVQLAPYHLPIRPEHEWAAAPCAHAATIVAAEEAPR